MPTNTIIPQDIFRSGNQVEKLYRSGNPIHKMYRSGELIYMNMVEPEEIHYEEIPLTFDIVSGGTILWKSTKSSVTRIIEYKLNNGEWTSITGDTTGTSISVVEGDKVQFRGNNSAYATKADYAVRFSGSSCRFNLYGNLMSLIDPTNYPNIQSLTGEYNFWAMFYNTRVIDASNLIMPTGLTDYCFYYFFKDCGSLTTAPVLPAKNLLTGTYYYMFENCSNLAYIKCLATSIGSVSTNGWVSGVASTGTFVKPVGIVWGTGANGIPSGWTVEEV